MNQEQKLVDWLRISNYHDQADIFENTLTKRNQILALVAELGETKIFSVMNHYDIHLKAKKLLEEIGES